ncbi:MAG: hypothetical protein Q4C95_08585 [Planctomycetia bacterium]|nr:hypothetical protein [Planctomycetia bacterium]
MNKIFKIAFVSLCCLILFNLTGCEKKNPDGRENVSGMITLNGEPLQGSAGIHFDPVDGDKTAGGHGQIMTGKYLLTGQDGVKPGKYIVRISALATFDKRTDDYATADTLFEHEYTVTVVPPEFNVGSTIEFEVVKGKKNIFDYDIKTDFQPEKVSKGAKPVVE